MTEVALWKFRFKRNPKNKSGLLGVKGGTMYRNGALLALAITGITVILVTAVGGLPSVVGAPTPAQSIVGTWVTIPTLPGRPPGTPNVATFTSDGTVIQSRPFGSESSGNGVWISTGNRVVSFTWIFFRRSASGDYIGTTKVRGKYTLNATYDALTGSGKRDDFDAQGKLVRSVDFVSYGTRMKVESP